MERTFLHGLHFAKSNWRSISWWACGAIAISLVGLGVYYDFQNYTNDSTHMTMVSALFRISEIIIVGLVAMPIVRFLLYQWGVRRQEFLNRLAGTTLSLYLSHCHGRPRTDPTRGEISQFETFYNKLAGRHLYIMPAAMLLVIVALL
jgi:hypothetical protein